jgi:hypothetical protein
MAPIYALRFYSAISDSFSQIDVLRVSDSSAWVAERVVGRAHTPGLYKHTRKINVYLIRWV